MPHPCTVSVQPIKVRVVAVIATTEGLVSVTRICVVPNRKTPECTGRCMHTPGRFSRRRVGRLPHNPQATCFSPAHARTIAYLDYVSSYRASYQHIIVYQLFGTVQGNYVPPSKFGHTYSDQHAVDWSSNIAGC
jgi:hypothetical protein